ncbi:hypothetical protein [Bosea sp. (in: a-proteobacteria)]|jgi:hypothetical protein|uniref:Uncharacterized protein n=1 Tax=Bosea vaviloviae TaxID=1526658 RepID=A0A0N0MB12_9HYPH|nr:hypothetical protein AE618_13550 [Bosea vaviloviae]
MTGRIDDEAEPTDRVLAGWKLADRLRLPMLLPGCFRISRPLPLLVSQAASLLVKRASGRGVTSDQEMIEPMGA